MIPYTSEVIVGSRWWFLDTSLPRTMPYVIVVVDKNRRNVLFDKFIVVQTFGDIDAIRDSLFYTKEDAERYLVKYVSEGRLHFIEEDGITKLIKKYPEEAI